MVLSIERDRTFARIRPPLILSIESRLSGLVAPLNATVALILSPLVQCLLALPENVPAVTGQPVTLRESMVGVVSVHCLNGAEWTQGN